MILVGRRVKFEVERPSGEGIVSLLLDGAFLAFGIAAATDEGQYSKAVSSYSCALIEDAFGFVHSIPLDKFKFVDPDICGEQTL